MKTTETVKNDKWAEFKSLRVKKGTKEKVDGRLKLINKADDCGKVNCDQLISFLIDSLTDEKIKELQHSTITWKQEEARLRKVYSMKNGKISDEKWKELIFTGQLQPFVAEHSRLKI